MLQQARLDARGDRRGDAAETPAVLFARYRNYRRRQVAQLLHLVPRDAVRELYARARRWAGERGVHDPKDPMATLGAFAEELLPLPPFEVWAEDRARHPLGHLEEGEEEPQPADARPRRIEDRRFDYGGRTWVASLNVFRDGAAWRGFLGFRETGGGRRHHTANIFLEDTAREARERFRELDRASLGAFLRSVLP